MCVGRLCGRPCRRTHGDSAEVERTSVKSEFGSDCVVDYSQACPHRHVRNGDLCQAPAGASAGRCGLTLPSTYNAKEKAAYAETCLTVWPCVGATQMQ